MKAQESLVGFQNFAARRGAIIERLFAIDAAVLMADFYREIRIESCDPSTDGDKLLFQWGIYKFSGRDELFDYDITRQMVPFSDEYGEIFVWQLSLALKFEPSESLYRIGKGNVWCHGPDEVDEFLAFIRNCEATAQVMKLVPKTVQLTFDDAE